jgi:hypothetical protein
MLPRAPVRSEPTEVAKKTGRPRFSGYLGFDADAGAALGKAEPSMGVTFAVAAGTGLSTADLRAGLSTANPLALPLALLACGLFALLMFFVRGRRATFARRSLQGAYLTLFVVAVATAGGVSVVRAGQFWGVHSEGHGTVLVLERMFPLSDVRLSVGDVKHICEISMAERGLVGRYPTVRYEVVTRDDNSYWSAPIEREAYRRETLGVLACASHGRLQRFSAGQITLP